MLLFMAIFVLQKRDLKRYKMFTWLVNIVILVTGLINTKENYFVVLAQNKLILWFLFLWS